MKTILALSLCLLTLTARPQSVTVMANVAHAPGVVEYRLYYGNDQKALTNLVSLRGCLDTVTNVNLCLDRRLYWIVQMTTVYNTGYIITNGWSYYYPATNTIWLTTQMAPSPDGPWTDYATITQRLNTNGACYFRTKTTIAR